MADDAITHDGIGGLASPIWICGPPSPSLSPSPFDQFRLKSTAESIKIKEALFALCMVGHLVGEPQTDNPINKDVT